MAPSSITVQAPAKVNYRLDVLRRRPDGYHDLRMIMQRIDLCDEITISLTSGNDVRVSCGKHGVPDGPGNIAWRAATAMLAATGSSAGVDIAISKMIPVAAGLGGGSSDAATVLLALNDLLDAGLSNEKLREIGLTLGADVPFFVFGQTALAEGVGEVLTPVTGLPEAWIVLVNPNIHVSTAWVYQNLQLTNPRVDYTLPRFCGKLDDICGILHNDLESVTMQRFPVIGEIKERIATEGAAGVLMSGSGPTVFGVFASEPEARSCSAVINKETGWFSAAVKTL